MIQGDIVTCLLAVPAIAKVKLFRFGFRHRNKGAFLTPRDTIYLFPILAPCYPSFLLLAQGMSLSESFLNDIMLRGIVPDLLMKKETL